MTTNFKKVLEFHHFYECAIGKYPQFPENETMELRLSLIDEERKELEDAIKDKDIVEVADALTDLLYVIYGMGITFGIDLDATFKEVHRSNMSKLGEDGKPIRREDGKVLKGPNYSPPDLKILIQEMYLTSL